MVDVPSGVAVTSGRPRSVGDAILGQLVGPWKGGLKVALTSRFGSDNILGGRAGARGGEEEG